MMTDDEHFIEERRSGGKYWSYCADDVSGQRIEKVDASGTISHFIIAESHFHFDVDIVAESRVDRSGALRFLVASKRCLGWTLQKPTTIEYDPGTKPEEIKLGSCPVKTFGTSGSATEALKTKFEILRTVDKDRLDDFAVTIKLSP